MWNRKTFIRIIEVLLCLACVVTLRVTDDESRRVYLRNRYRSREWPLSQNVTQGVIGAAVATVTVGGYLIVTFGLLIAAATGELRGRKTEIFFLALGIVLFCIVGGISLFSIEDVHYDLEDNAIIFGVLCLVTAFIFLVDLLISPPRDKLKKLGGTQAVFSIKDSAKKVTETMLIVERENSKTQPAQSKTVKDTKDHNGNVNESATTNDDYGHKETTMSQNNLEDNNIRSNHNQIKIHHSSKIDDILEGDRDRKFDHVERQLREYAVQNFQNGRTLRNSQRYRDNFEDIRDHRFTRESYGDDRFEETRIVYKNHDIYQRPVDEVDTPPFPINYEKRVEPIFAKIVNPGVKIMKVERDLEDSYRYSDSSQYDNVPVKMRGNSPGILKRGRDVSFNVPPPPKVYLKNSERNKDDMEEIDEYLVAFRMSSTGTQTGLTIPSSPTDPGYVRHTASNWPHDQKTKTPGSSPTYTRDS